MVEKKNITMQQLYSLLYVCTYAAQQTWKWLEIIASSKVWFCIRFIRVFRYSLTSLQQWLNHEICMKYNSHKKRLVLFVSVYVWTAWHLNLRLYVYLVLRVMFVLKTQLLKFVSIQLKYSLLTFLNSFSLYFLVLVPQSILKIQKIVRGFIGRKQYAVFLESRLVELIDIPASIRIQRYVRGYIGTVRYKYIFLYLCLISFFVFCITLYLYFCIYFVIDLWQSIQVNYTTLRLIENWFHHNVTSHRKLISWQNLKQYDKNTVKCTLTFLCQIIPFR